MERVLEDVSFSGPDVARRPATREGGGAVGVDHKEASTPPPYPEDDQDRPGEGLPYHDEYVKQMVASIVQDHDLSRYIL